MGAEPKCNSPINMKIYCKVKILSYVKPVMQNVKKTYMYIDPPNDKLCIEYVFNTRIYDKYITYHYAVK
jgi:hypothetical protein